jgi:hypothetical protein
MRQSMLGVGVMHEQVVAKHRGLQLAAGSTGTDWWLQAYY